MLYLSSIPVLLLLGLLAVAAGRRIVDLLPDPLRISTGFFVAPLLGLAGLVLIATAYGWLSPFKTGISVSLFVALLLLALVFEKNRAELMRDWLIVSGFVLAATLPIFAPAIRFDAFNPLNDTFTYLVHGQWLQEHAYSEDVRGSGFYPALTQVVLYQSAGSRMGASFFLGFVQSLFKLEWSYHAYLPAVGLAFAVGSLAIGGMIAQVVPVSRMVGVVSLCLLPAFSMNGFLYGAQGGFLPQTFGLAFTAGVACLVPGLIGHILDTKLSWTQQFRPLLPLAFCIAALLLTYNDMFLLLGSAIGIFLVLVCSLYWSEKSRIVAFASILAVEVALIVNLESARILRNFIAVLVGTASGDLRFGWQVPWSLTQFVAFSFGMKAPVGGIGSGLDLLISIWLFPVLLVIIVVLLTRVVRERPRNLTIPFLLCVNLVFWVAFAKFRYATPGLEGETGVTFLQFKITKWLAPTNLALLGIAAAWLFVNAGRHKRTVGSAFIAALILGTALQFTRAAAVYTRHFQDETMRRYSSFNVFLELRSRLSSVPKDQVIYLRIPFEHHKLLHMAAYILMDRKLASKYLDDGYLIAHIPVNERDMPLEIAEWMIDLRRTPAADENPLNRVGPFYIRRAPFETSNAGPPGGHVQRRPEK